MSAFFSKYLKNLEAQYQFTTALKTASMKHGEELQQCADTKNKEYNARLNCDLADYEFDCSYGCKRQHFDKREYVESMDCIEKCKEFRKKYYQEHCQFYPQFNTSGQDETVVQKSSDK